MYGDSDTARRPLTKVISMLHTTCNGSFEHHEILAARTKGMNPSVWRLESTFAQLSDRLLDTVKGFSNVVLECCNSCRDLERTKCLKYPAILRLLG